MTNTDNTEDNISISPLAGAILQASVQQAEGTTEQLLENKDREIAEWKDAFAKLYRSVDVANDSVDSMKIGRILDRFSQRHAWAVQKDNFT